MQTPFIRPTVQRGVTFFFPEPIKKDPPPWHKSDTPGKPDTPPTPMEHFDVRCAKTFITERIREGKLRFSPRLDLREVFRHSCLSLSCAFNAIPGVILRSHLDDNALSEVFRPHVTSREGAHIATIADVAWVVPQVADRLVEHAAFLAPLRSAEGDPSAPVTICIIRQDPRHPEKRAWYVQPAHNLASTYRGDFPVLRIAYARTPSPLSVG